MCEYKCVCSKKKSKSNSTLKVNSSVDIILYNNQTVISVGSYDLIPVLARVAIFCLFFCITAQVKHLRKLAVVLLKIAGKTHNNIAILLKTADTPYSHKNYPEIN